MSNLPAGYGGKRFVKTYHRIRFNAGPADYIPNFDDFDQGSKKKVVALLSRSRRGNIEKMADAEIDDLFQKTVAREIVELERDLQEVTS